jgi:cytoskeletal protein RodZ
MSDRNAPAAGHIETRSFGPALREEREQLGVSLERLVAETKVQRHYLEAVEGNNFRALPGGVFRRGIVRAYLHALRLEEQIWMPRFEAVYAAQSGDSSSSTSTETDWFAFAENVKRNRGARRQRTAMRWLGVILLLTMLLIAAWAVFHFVVTNRLLRRASSSSAAVSVQSGTAVGAPGPVRPSPDTGQPAQIGSDPAPAER